MFTKILVPVDGSSHSEKALKYAISIAKEYNGTICLIHIVSTSPLVSAPISEVGIPGAVSGLPTSALSLKVIEGMRKAGEKILTKYEAAVKAEGIPVTCVLDDGNPVERIVKTAEEGKYSLIVMGARGISKVKALLLGSVSDGVCRKAPCPVLIIK
jgi:nucleotide-binding universal stress UspA family protein